MSEVRTLTKVIEYCEDKLKSSSGEVKECLKEIKKIYYLKNYYDPKLSNYNEDWEDYEFTKEEVEIHIGEDISNELYENMMSHLDQTKRLILQDELEGVYDREKDDLRREEKTK
jgi:hypothetical protein